MERISAVCLALFLAAASSPAAGKVYWQNNGVLISGIDGMGIGDLLSDGRGGAYNITGDIDSVFIIRVDRDGGLPWGLAGRVVDNDDAGGLALQMNPLAASDGASGAIIVWDKFFPWGHELYAQRMDSSGTKRWGANSIKVTQSDSSQENHVVSSDGRGGAIVAWQQYMHGQYDIYAQRLDSLGARRWGSYGVSIAEDVNTAEPAIAGNVIKGIVISWSDDRNGSYDVYAQRLDSIGNKTWNLSGNAVCTADSGQFIYKGGVTMDDSGKAIICWTDKRGYDYDVYSQRVNNAGNIEWLYNGIPVCVANGNQYEPVIVVGNIIDNGAIYAWGDYRNGLMPDIFAQRVDNGGNVKWSINGLGICVNDSIQEKLQIIPDNLSGAIICWQDKRSGNNDIYAQHVDSAGAMKWEVNGLIVCNEIRTQERPRIVQSDSGTAIVAWPDYRTNYARAYAQRIGDDGSGVAGLSTPLEVRGVNLWQNRPNPFRQTTTVRYQITEPGHVGLKVYNVAGQCVRTLLDGYQVPGSHEVRWDGRDHGATRVAGGVYLVRLSATGTEFIEKAILLR